jgi:hypothetical protein
MGRQRLREFSEFPSHYPASLIDLTDYAFNDIGGLLTVLAFFDLDQLIQTVSLFLKDLERDKVTLLPPHPS